MAGITRRALAGLAILGALPQRGWAQASMAPIRIGVLNDQSGVFSDSTGEGSVIAARLAAEEFGAATGRRVEILAADHQNKPDLGSNIARQWFDRDGVHAIADLGNSAVALAVNTLAREKDKVCLVSAGGTTALTGAQCSPNTIHWTYDTYGQSTSLAESLARAGKKRWFFITADYTFGHSLQDEATRALTRLGGTVVGSVRHPINSNDFSSYLLHAQASGAEVVALANGGEDTGRAAKQAREFGLTDTQTIVGLAMLITDANALGLETAQGLLVTETFYWDLNDRTRAFSQRWSDRNRGRKPTMMQAGTYGAVVHYLRAIHALGKAESGAEVVRKMKELPTDDDAFGTGMVRADGRKIHENYVFRVKRPADSRRPWDYYDLVSTVPGDAAFRPMAEGGCPLLGSMTTK
ncbi:ABC transporter substrate-binding protein [uncultured Bosea sp.]|uniref:ABC transporter substrate-binding protein n=1 Tax=uncultured Bosea sp. TaxID=211457 RepID=UPI0025F123D6|nr:ABC transporter substrate-binding protein [uncultured Bosea sp.]